MSDLSKTGLDTNDPHVSSFQGPAFVEIGTQFAAQACGWDTTELNSDAAAGYAKFKDRDLAQRWPRPPQGARRAQPADWAGEPAAHTLSS
ncbi:hypothetical protein [Streptomyces sp. NPDC055287]